jgi:hypothetical protein
VVDAAAAAAARHSVRSDNKNTKHAILRALSFSQKKPNNF